jgi:carboxypeptidase Taq
MSEGSPGRAAYEELTRDLRESAVLASAGAVLAWDQETLLPPRGFQLRADQLAVLSGIVHERRTRPQVGEWLAAAESDGVLTADGEAAANLREIRREYDRAVTLPASLVREIAQTGALAQQAWRDAREASDFARFAPWLQKTYDLARARGECYRPGATAAEGYEALMDEYEPGATVEPLVGIFAELRERLTPLIAEITAAAGSAAGPLDGLKIPTDRQMAFDRQVAERIGFDFAGGRLDTSTHPFCEGIGPGDTRLTTRFHEETFLDSLSSTLHEAGHGLYEQGLPKEEHHGSPLGESASLGLHESQSRLWENLVGRSRPFWEWALPVARRSLGSELSGVTVDDLYRAANRVRPGLIRVDSDEATYNLHVLLRFDLERALFSGELGVADLPGAWNERMRQDLGVTVPDDRRGCLQDIHWSMGAVGYFPTYTLGNLYAAILHGSIDRDLGGVGRVVEEGRLVAVRDWLAEKVHGVGHRWDAEEIVARATGERLSAAPFLAYLRSKYGALYGVSL